VAPFAFGLGSEACLRQSRRRADQARRLLAALAGVRHTRGACPVKAATPVGIALVVLGVLSLAYQGITYTTHEKVVEVEENSAGD
jgi:hypothetical protein